MCGHKRKEIKTNPLIWFRALQSLDPHNLLREASMLLYQPVRESVASLEVLRISVHRAADVHSYKLLAGGAWLAQFDIENEASSWDRGHRIGCILARIESKACSKKESIVKK